MKKEVVVNDKVFEVFKTRKQIQKKVKKIAKEINVLHTYNSTEIVFISILNGSFVFTADLCRELNFLPEMQFIKVKSYKGTKTTGKIEEIIGLTSSIKNKTVYIIEDIIDTGLTISDLYTKLLDFEPEEINIVSFLYKPDNYKGINLEIMPGFIIPNNFVLGYGMDYNEIGRNLKDLYVLKE